VSKFRDCVRSIESTFPKTKQLSSAADGSKERKQVLVPLTESLYVTGFLGPAPKDEDEDEDLEDDEKDSQEEVLVDIGTGFFVGKNREEAIKFYEERVKDVSAKITEVEEAIRGKSDMVRVLEEGECFVCY
jgi:prefoldin alpha subunit